MAASPHFRPEGSALALIDHQVGTLQLFQDDITPDIAIRR